MFCTIVSMVCLFFMTQFVASIWKHFITAFLRFSFVIVIDLLATETVIRKFEEEDSKKFNYMMMKKPLHCSFLSIVETWQSMYV